MDIIFSDRLNEEGFNDQTLIIVDVSREEVERLDLTRVKEVIKMGSKRKDRLRNALSISFNGYNDVPDEVYEIKEIREWTKKLFQTYPHIMYFIDDKIGSDDIILTCYCDLTSYYQGEKLSINEIIERGVELKDYPILLSLNSKVLKNMCESIKEYGRKIKDIQGANKIANRMKEKFSL